MSNCHSHIFFSLPLQLYLVDAFTYAASALAASSVCHPISCLFSLNGLIICPRSCDPSLDLLSLCSVRSGIVLIDRHIDARSGDQMFAAMGIGGGNSFLGGMTIVLGIPFPLWIYYYGETIRARNPLNR